MWGEHMAFVVNDKQQLNLSDSTFNLTTREQKFLDKSWAKIFSEKIFPAIKEEDFSVLYSNKASRPNTPVNVIVGALILKEILGNTDDELVQALMFDIRYQYALHTTSFEEQPLSDRTLSRFRARCLAYETKTGIDLIHGCVTHLAKEIASVMKLTPHMQRMDSLMVSANIRNLSLLELFYTCVANLAKLMNQRNTEIPEAQKHYIEKDDYNHFIYYQRELDTLERTVVVMKDAEILIDLCDEDYDESSEYQLLIRLLKEQTIFEDDGNRRLRKKEEKEQASKVLMNPADPEATFRKKAGHKHIGYIGNIVETVGENGSLVTDYAYEKNIYSDSQFAKDYIEAQPKHEKPIVLVSDGAFGSESNIAKAKEHRIKFITTNFTGIKPDEIYAEFKFNEDKTRLLQCANQKSPDKCVYDSSNDKCVVYYGQEVCNNCQYKDRCKPYPLKTRYRKEVSWKAVNRAKKLQYMKTDEFKKYAHFRNGVEAIPSLLRRKYKVDKIPSRGKKETKFYFGFKIAALNFQKLLAYSNSLDKCTQKLKTA